MAAVTGFLMVGQVFIWASHFRMCGSENSSTYDIGADYSSNYHFSDESTSTEMFDYSIISTPCQKASNRIFRSWFLPTAYTIICLLALVGNSLVILTYIYFKRLKTMTDVYLLNLALADLLFALTLPLWAASFIPPWILGLVPCKAMFAIYKISFFSGMFLLTCISMDRYFSITKAVYAHRFRSNSVYYAKMSSIVTWIMALLFSIPEMVYSKVNANDTCVPSAEDLGMEHLSILVGQLVVGFVLPAIIITFCYSCIIRTLAQARSFEKNKAFKVVFAVMTVFLLSQLPYNFVLGLNTVSTSDCFYENGLLYAMDVTQGVAFLRCCVNPFVYAFIGVKFRKDLLRLMKDMGCIILFTPYGRRKSSLAMETETTTFSP